MINQFRKFLNKFKRESEWKPFWFESNSAWGYAKNREDWKDIRENWYKGAHGMKRKQIYDAKLAEMQNRIALPSYGFRVEHIGGKKTLREFFIENNMPMD